MDGWVNGWCTDGLAVLCPHTHTHLLTPHPHALATHPLVTPPPAPHHRPTVLALPFLRDVGYRRLRCTGAGCFAGGIIAVSSKRTLSSLGVVGLRAGGRLSTGIWASVIAFSATKLWGRSFRPADGNVNDG